MLCIGRRRGERFWIGDSCVTILSVNGKEVRVGIDARREVLVEREELRRERLARLTPPAKPSEEDVHE